MQKNQPTKNPRSIPFPRGVKRKRSPQARARRRSQRRSRKRLVLPPVMPHNPSEGSPNLEPPNCVANYMMTLADPKQFMARIPDAFSGVTSLFRSIQTFELSVTPNATADSGRFSFAVQPTLGSISDLQDYKIALVDSSQPWPIGDFTDPARYVKQIGGSDIRLDPFWAQMTQAANFFYGVVSNSVAGTAGMTALTPFGNLTPFGFASSLARSGQFINGIQIVYDLAGPGNSSNFQIPAGEYWFEMISDVTLNLTFTNATATSVAGSVITGGTVLGGLLVVNSPGGDISVTGSAAPVAAGFILTPATAEGLDISKNNGIVTQIRPVACSVLTTYNNSVLNNAGQIAAAWVPAATCQQAYFTTVASNANKQLQNWEALADITTGYDGRLDDGSYVWWSPKSIGDTDFRTPDDMDDHAFPCLIVSGQFNPVGAVLGTPNQVARVEVVTVYEFQTNTILFESEAMLGNSLMMELALNLVNQEPHSGKNDEHVGFFQRIVRAAKKTGRLLGNFLWDNRSAIVSGVGSAAMALL